MSGDARCGHGHYDKGHCAQPGCPNDYRICRECNPQPEPSPRRARYVDPFEREASDG